MVIFKRISLEKTTGDECLESSDFRGSNLSRLYFSQKNFTKANLSCANLSYSKFLWVNLTRANFANANLANSAFADSNLTESDFTGANLSGANFYSSTLNATIFEDAVLSNIPINRGTDFSKIIGTPRELSIAWPSQWTPNDVDRYLDHIANQETGSVLTRIHHWPKSLSSFKLPVLKSLVNELVDKKVDLRGARPALWDILNHYRAEKEILMFLLDHILAPQLEEAGSKVVKFDSSALEMIVSRWGDEGIPETVSSEAFYK